MHVRVDCRGLTAGEVMAEVRRRAAASPEALPVLRLDNVRWAGPLLTSSDPERIATVVRHRLAMDLGVTVEVTGSPVREAAGPREAPTVDGLTPEAVRAVLAAAAGLERRRAPVGVWQEVAQALAGGPVPLAGLRAVADALPDLLVLEDGTDGGEDVRFVDDPAHHAAREAFALSSADQEVVTGALLRLWPAHPADATGAYIAWALPVHAAVAGVLPGLLTDAAFVARVHWYALWQGLALAWPEGVPADCLASDVHYLQAQGVLPATQGEWAAWLHHAAVSRGDTAFADLLADRAGPLPWRTLWSHWRLPGKLGSQPEAGWVEGLSAYAHGESRSVAHRRGPEQTGPGDDPEELRVWDAWTGEPRDSGLDPAPSDGEPVPGVRYALNQGGGWEMLSEPVPGAPRAPRPVGEAVRLGETPDGSALWVFAGTGGIYGAEVDEEAVLTLPEDPWSEPSAPGPLTHSAPWPPPWPLPSDGGTTREWLEDRNAFRAGACRPLPETSIPAAVRHEPTRRFLSRVGWPLSHGIGSLHSPDLNTDGLRPSDDHPGLLTGLGQIGARSLLLDGADGRVYLTGHHRAGREAHLAGSSVERLLTLLLLQHTAWSAPLTLGGPETDDLAESLRLWCRTVDPEATGSPAWDGAFHDLDAAAEDYAMVLGELDAWTS